MILVAYRHGLRASEAREQDPKSPFVLTSEPGAPLTSAGFAKMVERAGEAAKLGFKAHPHMTLLITRQNPASSGPAAKTLMAAMKQRDKPAATARASEIGQSTSVADRETVISDKQRSYSGLRP
jgi:hypothetical protein